MNWTAKDSRRARRATNRLIDMAEEGIVDWETLARDLLGWMSEAGVAEFARHNHYFDPDGDDERDEE